ncbi:LuxR C-terminal-related transcriptional regulator [Halomonas sp. LES1]|uniref:response regulator transcription factor n=2 Tax=unclassified Halomonas TaxID=2609666 RepID=UPI002888AE16|nr:LuxR C-terminal-related transcriptional regulator [Halomonas sp. LES1]MDT0510504.1 LuxR C-terminal-related transcriptional regulator [Halomonas sp. LES1]
MDHAPQFLEFAGYRCRFGRRGSGLPTAKQVMVLAGLASGMTQKEIAQARGISPATVKSTAEALYYHLHAIRATDAVARAIRRGWIAPLLLALMVGGLHQDTTQLIRVRQPVCTRQPVSSTSRIARRDLGSVYA